MKPAEFALLPVAMLIGLLLAYSIDRWMSAADEGAAELRLAKKELVSSAGLFELHNAIYSKVGPQVWESQVKPGFLRAITYATIRESGNLLPDWREIVAWVRAHPEDARRMMEEAVPR